MHTVSRARDTAHAGWLSTLCLALVVVALSVVWWWSSVPGVFSAMFSPQNALASATAWQHPLAPPGSSSASGSPGDATPLAPSALDKFPAQQACTGTSRDVFNTSAAIAQDEWLCGDLRVYNGDATVAGRIGGATTVVHGSLDVSGEVDGNVTVVGGSVDLRPGARIGGGISVIGGTLVRADSTFVGGPIATDNALHQEAITTFLGLDGTYTFPWSHMIFWAILGGLLAVLFPRQLALVHHTMRDELPQSVGVGVLASLGGSALAVVLTLTCIGIPLAALLLAALWAAWAVGTVAAGAWLGSRMLGIALPERRTPALATMLGVTTLSLVKAIPCVGSVLSLVIGCVGLGAAVLALLYARRSAKRARWARRHDLVPL